MNDWKSQGGPGEEDALEERGRREGASSTTCV